MWRKALLLFPVILVCLIALLLPAFFEKDENKWLTYYGSIVGAVASVSAALIVVRQELQNNKEQTREDYRNSLSLEKRKEVKEENGTLVYMLHIMSFGVTYFKAIVAVPSKFGIELSTLSFGDSSYFTKEIKLQLVHIFDYIAQMRKLGIVPGIEEIRLTRSLDHKELQIRLIGALAIIKETSSSFYIRASSQTNYSDVFGALVILKRILSEEWESKLEKLVVDIKATIKANDLIICSINDKCNEEQE